MASMDVIEAATILMDLSTFKCNNQHFKDPTTRKRKNADPETDFIFIPKRPKSTRVKKTKPAAAATPPMWDTIFIPRRPRTQRVAIMKSTAAAIPPRRIKIIPPKRPSSPRVEKMESVVMPPRRIIIIPPKRPSSPRVEKKKPRAKEMNMTVTPKMPVTMRERILEMGGYEMELVIEKKLHDTDLKKNQGRLSLPIKKLIFDFATEEETEVLNQHVDKKGKMGIDVMIIDPSLRETVICLKKWKIGSSGDDVYCLMTHWNTFVQQNCLKSGQVVQLWSFRKDGVDVANQTENPHHLCFAMVKC